ncbi:hypothetical protein NMY22_g11789 [Coprinellus aureogranulatus]|nr:hypothetical protein NMY22_g11789 [Coprinellus aureogranulatus]
MLRGQTIRGNTVECPVCRTPWDGHIPHGVFLDLEAGDSGEEDDVAKEVERVELGGGKQAKHNDRLMKRKELYKAKYMRTQAENGRLAKEVDALKEELEHVREGGEMKSLEEQVQAQEQQIHAQRQRIHVLEREAQSQQSHLHTLENRNALISAQLEKEKRAKEALRMEVKEMKQRAEREREALEASLEEEKRKTALAKRKAKGMKDEERSITRVTDSAVIPSEQHGENDVELRDSSGDAIERIRLRRKGEPGQGRQASRHVRASKFAEGRHLPARPHPGPPSTDERLGCEDQHNDLGSSIPLYHSPLRSPSALHFSPHAPIADRPTNLRKGLSRPQHVRPTSDRRNCAFKLTLRHFSSLSDCSSSSTIAHSQAEHHVSSPTSSSLTDAHTRRPHAGHSVRRFVLRNALNVLLKRSGVAYKDATFARRLSAHPIPCTFIPRPFAVLHLQLSPCIIHHHLPHFSLHQRVLTGILGIALGLPSLGCPFAVHGVVPQLSPRSTSASRLPAGCIRTSARKSESVIPGACTLSPCPPSTIPNRSPL